MSIIRAALIAFCMVCSLRGIVLGKATYNTNKKIDCYFSAILNCLIMMYLL